jgi:hypothetical protein
VLNGPHACLKRGHDSRLAVAVRRDHAFRHPRDFHDRAQFGRGELLMHGIVKLGHHATRRVQFDDASTAPQLLANRAGAVIATVAQPQERRHATVALDPLQRIGVQVAVAGNHRQGSSGRVDRRPFGRPLADRSGQDRAETAHLPHRGYPGVERRSQITNAARCPQFDGLKRHPVLIGYPQAD